MRLPVFAYCLLLFGCDDRMVTTNNQMALPANNSLEDSNVIAINESIADVSYKTPEEHKATIARREREDREAERFDRWQARVLPTPRNAFPKIGTCYRSSIKEMGITHGQVGNGSTPYRPGDEWGARWDRKWTWEKYPIRDHGRIAIPFGGYILYSNGLQQPFDSGIWTKREPPPFARARVGDKVVMCVVALPDHCPPGDFRGVIYRTHDLRTGGVWKEGDSQHMCGGQ